MNTFCLPINKKLLFSLFLIIIYIGKVKRKSINEDKNKYLINNNETSKANNISNFQPLKIKRTIINKISKRKNKINNKNLKKIQKIKIKRKLFINPYYENELKFYETFLSLKKMPNNMNNSIIIKEKNDIFCKISENVGMNISSLEEVYFNTDSRFGNELIKINKLIFYCEIIGVKKIILNKDNNLYLNHTIHDPNFNLTIEINKENFNNINDNNYNNDIIDDNMDEIDNSLYNPHTNYFPNIFFIFFNLKVENRLEVIKKEILRNLPEVNISNRDLFIHIRGGDIFKPEATNPDYCSSYAQYPLCFYTKIIENYKFNKLYIISEDKLNPIVNKLLDRYSNAIYHNNSLEKDISYLAHAYNIVGSVSSFITSIIKLNNNLRYFWEYDIYQMEHKLYHLHHSLYNYPRNYTIFRMEPSKRYQKYMYKWVRSQSQINIMLNDKCPNNFTIIFPNI